MPDGVYLLLDGMGVADRPLEPLGELTLEMPRLEVAAVTRSVNMTARPLLFPARRLSR